MALDAAAITEAIVKLDAWLDTMRGPDGYGGPVAHWWQNCLQFTGAGPDWRYEGIIIGYLNLYKRTGDEKWLAKARRAGDDLVRGQLPTGNFCNSCFELNPYAGGTPHEAACDLALLHLAAVLKEHGHAMWQTYAATAERNLQAYIIGVLWDEKRQVFRNTLSDTSFVPNKAATIVEALLAQAFLSGSNEVIERYVIPTLEAILQCQIKAPGERLDGAIDQAQRIGGEGAGKFFPLYIARCIPALLQGYALTEQERYLEAAQAAMAFLLRERLKNGSFPQVIYSNGHTNRYPQWVAGAGDILRAMKLMRECGMEIEIEPTMVWLLKGQHPNGGIRTAHGFASQGSQRPPRASDFRDILPVCGWADKAFRYLTGCVQGEVKPETANISDEFECDCIFQGRRLRYRENATVIELWDQEKIWYRWTKGAPWAETCIAKGGIK